MTRWFLRVTKRHHASGVPERADAFAKAGRCRVRLESPDSESDLSTGWKATDRKANGVPVISGRTKQNQPPRHLARPRLRKKVALAARPAGALRKTRNRKARYETKYFCHIDRNL